MNLKYNLKKILGSCLLPLLGICLSLVLISCSPRERGEPVMFDEGTQISDSQVIQSMPKCFIGDKSYAPVKKEWVIWFYGKFRNDLSSGAYGIVKWDEKFDCNRFAGDFASSAQIMYFQRSFSSFSKSKAVAIGEVWYVPDYIFNGVKMVLNINVDQKGNITRTGHAINFIFTDKEGLLFFEPQSGAFIQLSENEKKSIYFARL